MGTQETGKATSQALLLLLQGSIFETIQHLRNPGKATNVEAQAVLGLQPLI